MVLGTGIDIIEVARIQRAISRHGERFLNRIFTPREQAYCNKFSKNQCARYAGRFAAKEAVSKALGCGLGALISWLDIEVHSLPSGQPELILSEPASRHFRKPRLILSISHCESIATALAIWVACEPES